VGTGDLAYDAGDIADEMAFVTRGSVRILVDEGSRDTFVGTSSQGGYVASLPPTIISVFARWHPYSRNDDDDGGWQVFRGL